MSHSNQKTILKNTIFLYLRMFIVLTVSLFTTRVVLDKLGVENYGIYNIVGSVVVAFTFVNNALTSASQRFYSYALGKEENCTRIFSMSINVQFVMLIILVILLETIGLYFFNNVIEIPEGRRAAADIVYQFSVLTFILNFLRSPYNALIIAYEKMSVYAIFSIFDVMLKLVIVYLLIISSFDRLILYGFLMMLVTLFNNIMYMIYCKVKIKEVGFRLMWDTSLMKEMSGFLGWNLVGGLTGIATNEGPNYLLNIFCGVRLNAAMGIAKQVSALIFQFSSNFQTAFNPQIVKLYAAGNQEELKELAFRASKLSFFLMYIVALPIMCSQDIFQLWLKEIPEYTRIFCIFYLITQLIQSISSPLWMISHAVGHIRNYQLSISCLSLMIIPLSWLCLESGFHPSSVLGMLIIVNVCVLIYRVWYLKSKILFPASLYYKEVVLRNLILLPLFSAPFVYWIGSIVSGFFGLIVIGLSSIFFTTFIFFFLCLKNDERCVLINLLRGKLLKL